MANSLLLATVFRIGFVILSYGAKVPAGIFVPSMAIGATFGRMVGILVKAAYRYIILACFSKRENVDHFILYAGHTRRRGGLQYVSQIYRASPLGPTPSWVRLPL